MYTLHGCEVCTYLLLNITFNIKNQNHRVKKPGDELSGHRLFSFPGTLNDRSLIRALTALNDLFFFNPEKITEPDQL